MPTDTTGGGTVAGTAVSTTTTLQPARGSESDLLGKLLGGLIASVESLVTLEVVTIVSSLEVHHELEDDGKVRRWRARPPAAGAVDGAASSINLVTGDIRAVISERMLEPDRAALLAQHQGYVVEGRKIVADNLNAMLALARDLKADLRR